ncbi:MAG: hypothetical protein SH818_13735 [Saprospiraceae bacterium]|nr:hypothetical protein [Saprospiraceae bacterium]
MSYNVILTASAEKELYKFQKSEIQKIITCIDALQFNPRPKGYLKLKGPEDFFRVGVEILELFTPWMMLKVESISSLSGIEKMHTNKAFNRNSGVANMMKHEI